MASNLATLLAGIAILTANLMLDGHFMLHAAHAEALFQDNFDSGTAEVWEPRAGNWPVVDGEYIGEGTSVNPSCGATEGVYTDITVLQAANVEVEVDMRSIQRVDKMIIFRSKGPDNEIGINIRGEINDLIVQEMVDNKRVRCQGTFHTPEFSVETPPHVIGQTIHVRAILIGNRLQVFIDDVPVLDRKFDFFHHGPGLLGLGTIEGGITAFDNVKVRFWGPRRTESED
jgi:hypothetical protein